MAKKLQIGVKALILDKQKLLLIKRTEYSGAHLKNLWDIPGGRIKLGEEPEIGLHREVKEEVGNVSFKVSRPIQVKSIVNDEERQIVRITYLCKYIDGQVKLGSEHSDYSWVSLKKLPDNVDWLVLEAVKGMS